MSIICKSLFAINKDTKEFIAVNIRRHAVYKHMFITLILRHEQSNQNFRELWCSCEDIKACTLTKSGETTSVRSETYGVSWCCRQQLWGQWVSNGTPLLEPFSSVMVNLAKPLMLSGDSAWNELWGRWARNNPLIWVHWEFINVGGGNKWETFCRKLCTARCLFRCNYNAYGIL
jgi:hypothetical protein